MSRAIRVLAGAAAGLAVGGAAVLWALNQSAVHAPPCPTGWHTANAHAPSGTEALTTCRRENPSATLALVRTHAPAEGVASAAVVDAARRAAADPSAQPDPPDRGSSPDHLTDTLTTSTDGPSLPLHADVYFLAAGHRFGLLNLVHAPNAPFADRNAVAQWIDTIGGTAPWGAPDPGPMSAHCPDGFTTQPNTHPRGVVQCMFAPGTSRFAMIVLDWDEGGFDTDQDRARVASALAARVASAHGAQARIVTPPEPFTLAPHVDALHTEIDTGETVPTSVEAVAVLPSHGVRDVMAVGVGEPGAAIPRASEQMLADAGALHEVRKRLLTIAIGVGLVVAAFGVMAGLRLR